MSIAVKFRYCSAGTISHSIYLLQDSKKVVSTAKGN